MLPPLRTSRLALQPFLMQRLGMTPLGDTVADAPGAQYFAIEANAYFRRAGR